MNFISQFWIFSYFCGVLTFYLLLKINRVVMKIECRWWISQLKWTLCRLILTILGPLYVDRLIIMRSSYFFSISAITWHDIQQLSINLPKFAQFVQLMNWQNNSCKLVEKIVQSISKRITCKVFTRCDDEYPNISRGQLTQNEILVSSNLPENQPNFR